MNLYFEIFFISFIPMSYIFLVVEDTIIAKIQKFSISVYKPGSSASALII